MFGSVSTPRKSLCSVKAFAVNSVISFTSILVRRSICIEGNVVKCPDCPSISSPILSAPSSNIHLLDIVVGCLRPHHRRRCRQIWKVARNGVDFSASCSSLLLVSSPKPSTSSSSSSDSHGWSIKALGSHEWSFEAPSMAFRIFF